MFWTTKLNHKGQIVGKIEAKEIPFLVDTGATILLLNFKTKDKFHIGQNTVINLTAAFFSIPIAEDSQHLWHLHGEANN